MRDPVANPRAIFTPGSPVSTDSLFYGRQGQLRRVLDAVPAAGRHPLIFGLRGVGKTSLANVLRYFLPDHTVSRLACVEGDTFKTIWRRALRQVRLVYDEPRIGFATPPAERTGTLHDFLPGDNGIGAADVAEAVGEFGAHPLVFILDEFDRVTDQAAKSATADLVKSLSDSNPHVTLVLVGVGQSIRDLIGEHPSIERNLVQVEMPKMTSEEIVGLVERGLARLSISTTPGVLAEVAELADGFPYYAHLLGLSMAMTAQQMGNGAVSEDLFGDVVGEEREAAATRPAGGRGALRARRRHRAEGARPALPAARVRHRAGRVGGDRPRGAGVAASHRPAAHPGGVRPHQPLGPGGGRRPDRPDRVPVPAGGPHPARAGGGGGRPAGGHPDPTQLTRRLTCRAAANGGKQRRTRPAGR